MSVIIDNSAYVGADVQLGINVTVKHGAIIHGPTEIGDGTTVYPYAVIGETSQHKDSALKEEYIQIGRNTTIREFVTIHKPNRTSLTKIGDNCLIMAYCHIAHDCRLGDNVTMANATQLAGNVKVLSGANFGLSVVVHQHVIIGANSMIAMNETITRNVPPHSKIINGSIYSTNRLPEIYSDSDYLKSIKRGSINFHAAFVNEYENTISAHSKEFPKQRRRPNHTRS